jgi:hypothetical protein
MDSRSQRRTPPLGEDVKRWHEGKAQSGRRQRVDEEETGEVEQREGHRGTLGESEDERAEEEEGRKKKEGRN